MQRSVNTKLAFTIFEALSELYNIRDRDEMGIARSAKCSPGFSLHTKSQKCRVVKQSWFEELLCKNAVELVWWSKRIILSRQFSITSWGQG